MIDDKYNPVCRSTLTLGAERLEERRAKLQQDLSSTDNVSVTVDIWSDRRMRGFLGVTAHWLVKEEEQLHLRSNLLACDRFKGSHTAENICEQFERICDEYHIKSKLSYIISDNAANMRKAFSVCFPQESDGGNDHEDEESVDDPSLWQDLPSEAQQTVDVMMEKTGVSAMFCSYSAAGHCRRPERNKGDISSPF